MTTSRCGRSPRSAASFWTACTRPSQRPSSTPAQSRGT
jgi:hypothetical protein